MHAQSVVKGRVITTNKEPIHNAIITIKNTNISTTTDSNGNFQLSVTNNFSGSIHISASNYISRTYKIPLMQDEVFTIQVVLKPQDITEFRARIRIRNRDKGNITMDIKPLATTPSVTGDFLDLVKMLPGATSSNELSSQYSVRGGSYDENLIYVNDIEVYRPQLISSGQQEGLSFINGDLVSNLEFSAGGFEAKYGDKLSSVLDVQYRKPTKNTIGFQAGLLGGSIFAEGIKYRKTDDKLLKIPRFTYLIGARYRGNKNILNSLDAQGIYKSRFADFQSLLTYYFNPVNRLEWFSNLAINRYNFSPELQQTTFGTLQRATRLTIVFDGQEIMNYSTAMSALSYVHRTKRNELKLILSAFVSQESEHYDIEGGYSISEVDNNLGSSSFGDAKSLLGIGRFINHARNDLYFSVINLSLLQQKNIRVKMQSAKLLWGAKYQIEQIYDRFKEWKYSDSSDYNVSVPNPNTQVISMNSYIQSKANLLNHKASAYVQYQQGLGKYNQGNVTLGTRVLHTSLNNQTVVSPRAQVYFEPNKIYNLRLLVDTTKNYDSLKRNNVLLKLSGGYYYQAPFYREMRNFDGSINTQLKAQKSIHLVGGYEVAFRKWGRDLKFTADAYYKYLDYMVPYILDNIRIRYYAQNSATGYATGADMRLHGDFIKGVESWASLGLLKTDEIIRYIDNGNEVTSPKLRRPTDRRVSAAIFFQDELRKNSDFRVHLMLQFGSALPYYLGGNYRYKDLYHIPPYRRVDIGFSKMLLGGNSDKQKKYAQSNKRKFETLWLGVDVYNLLQINNVIGYLFIKDFQNNIYGVPNYLTGRRLNVRLVGQF